MNKQKKYQEQQQPQGLLPCLVLDPNENEMKFMCATECLFIRLFLTLFNAKWWLKHYSKNKNTKTEDKEKLKKQIERGSVVCCFCGCKTLFRLRIFSLHLFFLLRTNITVLSGYNLLPVECS